MTPDQYLQGILRNHNVDPNEAVKKGQSVIPIIQQWGGRQITDILVSGSIAKGTAVVGGTDLDLFVSLSSNTSGTLREIYESLAGTIRSKGYVTRQQNVSVRVYFGKTEIDIVPAKRQSQFGNDHSIYNNRKQAWQKTDINHHVGLIQNSRRINEIKLLKLWRNQSKLDFPSFYLELCVLTALYGLHTHLLFKNFVSCLEYLANDFVRARIVDPCNGQNVISDDLTRSEKEKIAAKAAASLQAQYLEQIVK